MTSCPRGWWCWGDKGGLFLNLWENRLEHSFETERAVGDSDEPYSTAPHDNAWDRAWRSEHEHFAQVVEHRTPPHPSPQNGLAVQKIIEAIYASGAAGREVEIT